MNFLILMQRLIELNNAVGTRDDKTLKSMIVEIQDDVLELQKKLSLHDHQNSSSLSSHLSSFSSKNAGSLKAIFPSGDES